MPTSNVVLTIQSKVAKERSPFKYYVPQITAANLPTFLTEHGTLKTALIDILAGTLRHEKVSIYDTLLDASIPVSNFARRELKLKMIYAGATSGNEHRAEIPCPDLDVLTFETGDANFVNLADSGVMAAFVAAWEAYACLEEDETDLAVVQSMQVVGRNL